MATPSSLIGHQIDQFRLDQFIAKGAMGLVFKAFDTILVRTVALKLISKKVEQDLTEEEITIREEARKRLIMEAKAAGRLNHPNILTIFSYGETEDFEFICMEYVTGKTLTQLLQERKVIEPADAIDIAEQILMALDAANKQQIVHRDIKPSNIMITDDGRLKVMDFGIAKLPSFSMTTTGTVLGTPYYMSPEQISGQKVDIRSDLFSVGAVLYQILTGERPFEATNTATLAYKIVQIEPTPPDEVNINIPHPLGAIVKKALAKDPLERYQSPVEMLKDIRALKQEQMAREFASADETIQAAMSKSDATVRVERREAVPLASLEGSGADATPLESAQVHEQPQEPPLPKPKIQLVPSQSDHDLVEDRTGPHAAAAKTGAASHPTEAQATQQPPPKASESPREPVRLDREKAESREVVATTRHVRASEGGAASTSSGSRSRSAESSGNGGKYILAAVLFLTLVSGGWFVNSLIKTKPPMIQPEQGTAEQAPPVTAAKPEKATDSATAPQTDRNEQEASQTATSSPPDRPTAQSLVAQAKSRQWENDPVQAQKLLEEALAIDPNDFEATFMLARVMTHRQEYQRAIELYKHSLTLGSPRPEVYFNLGYIYLTLGDYDSAIQNYEACLGLHPAYQDEVLTNLGIAYLKKKEDAKAQQLFQQALEINPSNFVARSYTRGAAGSTAAQQLSASTPTQAGPDASAENQPETRADPRTLSLIDQAKKVMQANGAMAEKLLLEAAALSPNYFDVNLQLGRLYTFQKKYDTAIGYYKSALRLNDREPDAYFNLGYIYLTMKDYDNAIKNYEDCLRLSPSYQDEVLTNLGLCYMKKDSPEQARSLFVQALDYNPKNDLARNYLQQLDKPHIAQPDTPSLTGAKGGATLSDASTLDGEYAVDGTNPSGSRYQGTASIKRSGDKYTVNLQIGNDSFSGTGMLSGDTLTVNWKNEAGGSGLVIYTLTKNGVLKGVWAGGQGSETLTPAP